MVCSTSCGFKVHVILPGACLIEYFVVDVSWMMCSSQLTRLSWFEGEILMWWVEGVLVVVSVPASHDWFCNKLYDCHCFSPLQEEYQHHEVSQSCYCYYEHEYMSHN